MKQFSTIKVGYTVGVYGCSGEYFNTIIINGDKITNVLHSGMYGSEERVNASLEAKGFTKVYLPSDFGKMTREEAKRFQSEYSAIEYIKANY